MAAGTRRALPRLAWLIALLFLSVQLRGNEVAWTLLVVLLVFSVPWRPDWWVYVLTGRTPTITGWLAERDAGAWQVVLDASGPRKIQVIKQVREATGTGLREAKGLVDGVPSVVAHDLSEEAASDFVGRLIAAGAAAHAAQA